MLSHLRRFRAHIAALAVTAGLAASAAAGGLLNLAIMCPDDVWAGSNISGIVLGGFCNVSIGAVDGCGDPLGPSFQGEVCPLAFSFPTTEPMAGTAAMVRARDEDEICTKIVAIR
jgi:hypothetical protein